MIEICGKTQQDATGRAIIQVTEAGENSISPYLCQFSVPLCSSQFTKIFPVLYKGANYTSLPSPTVSDLAPCSHLLLQNEIPFDATLSYLALSKSPALKRPITTIYNPSPMLTSAQISKEMKWDQIDWLVVNEGEAQQLLDAFPAPSQPETNLSEDILDSASRLISRLASQPLFKNVNVVCTLGPLGVIAHLPCATKAQVTQVIHEAGVPTKETRDTTGAGDCWTGYLVAGLMELEEKYASVPAAARLDEEDIRRLLRRCNQVSERVLSSLLFLDSLIPYHVKGCGNVRGEGWGDGEYSRERGSGRQV